MTCSDHRIHPHRLCLHPPDTSGINNEACSELLDVMDRFSILISVFGSSETALDRGGGIFSVGWVLVAASKSPISSRIHRFSSSFHMQSSYLRPLHQVPPPPCTEHRVRQSKHQICHPVYLYPIPTATLDENFEDILEQSPKSFVTANVVATSYNLVPKFDRNFQTCLEWTHITTYGVR